MISAFERIRILDATVFQLPDAFAIDYPGSGGSSNMAGVKIQLEYDLLSGQFATANSYLLPRILIQELKVASATVQAGSMPALIKKKRMFFLPCVAGTS